MGGCLSAPKTKPQAEHHRRSSKSRRHQQKKGGRDQDKDKEKPAKVGGAGAEAREKRESNVVPLGKRTNFGYQRDLDAHYKQGKLLGHGQFGYTYSATQISTGNKVAIKKIEKKQV